jgi:NADH dehydrogenase [ubiquinone] 1 alpha subcomplex assembly factor 6
MRARGPVRNSVIPPPEGGTAKPVPPTLDAVLRRYDRDRFQTTLLAPADRRPALMALYSFNFEVARIREVTREPLLGRIRLQWWRDAIAEIYAGHAPRRHNVVEALANAIRACDLSHAHFEALLAARELDMSDEAPASLEALEAYAEGSSSRLVLLALEALGVRDDAAIVVGQGVGIGYGLAGLLAAMPFHARMKRVYLPQDIIDSSGIDLQCGLFELKPSPELAESVHEIAALAGYHLDVARAQRAGMPRAALPALLLALPAARRLQRLKEAQYNVFDPRLARPDGLQSLRLAWAAWWRQY